MRTASSTEAAPELRPTLDSLQTVIRFLAPNFMALDREELHILCLDASYGLIEHFHFPVTDDAESDSRAILVAVLRAKRAVTVILAQNHLQGSAAAKAFEKQFRAKLGRALITVGIKLRDHIIFAPDRIWSLSENRSRRWPRRETLH
jgi:DNA repair protein RadC